MDENTQPGCLDDSIRHSGLFGPTRSDKEEEKESYDKEEEIQEEGEEGEEEGGTCLSDNFPPELLQQIFKLLPLKCLLAVGQVKSNIYTNGCSNLIQAPRVSGLLCTTVQR